MALDLLAIKESSTPEGFSKQWFQKCAQVIQMIQAGLHGFMMNVMREKNKVCNLKSSSGGEDVGILGNLDVRLNSFFFYTVMGF